MTTYFTTREEWLQVAAQEIAPHFEKAGFKLPKNIRFACSWPVGSRGNSKKILGQCVSPDASADGTTEVYVVPTIDCPKQALGVLVHELVHAAVGVKHGHKGPFKAACTKLGLEGPAKQALPGATLQRWLETAVLPEIGTYPHGAVNIDSRKKQATRMLKAVCPVSGYTVRLTRKWAEQGMPTSPAGEMMVLVEDGE